MNLTDYLRIIIRRGWIVLLAAILTAGAAFVLSKVQTKVYRATQSILIEPARPDFGLSQTVKQLMDSYSTRMDTDLRAQDVIDALKLDMTPGALHSMVNATSDLNNLVINIDVDMTDGDLAARVAQTYGQQFYQWRVAQNQPLDLADRINAELLDAPHPGLLRPNTTINVAAGALLGILIGGVAVFILEFLESNVMRRSKDVERYLQLPVLGNLPQN